MSILHTPISRLKHRRDSVPEDEMRRDRDWTRLCRWGSGPVFSNFLAESCSSCFSNVNPPFSMVISTFSFSVSPLQGGRRGPVRGGLSRGDTQASHACFYRHKHKGRTPSRVANPQVMTVLHAGERHHE